MEIRHVAFSPFLRTPRHVHLKGTSMTKMYVFIGTYSPILALTAAILGLYAMAIAIGCELPRGV